ncbi:DNA-binding phage protein [Peteryoungia aggregata LMG 23059]|uniref:DNA-binding phage protein n=1 Tax=Peteryoungia aggregata LMG 23059 TaxID=1368425 RepID=A0ABU0GCX9_9HYPH|nr:transcriptional regulator [Peteryoungia aggregata]MDQ0423213.1 DNA-binding phage protein [Peteryoungia aggregata LMG 23059]
MKDQPHNDAMASIFREDPTLAAATLDTILADGDQGELLVAVRQINMAFGGTSVSATPRSDDPPSSVGST